MPRISAAVFEARNTPAEVLGVVDLSSHADSKISMRLGEAIQFVANASVLGYDVRGAMVFHGEPGKRDRCSTST
ncbi:hypothetical protein EN828_04545 [Mesorhizobium sp. M2D.F.Ca.ET.185.01.1.1]|nr:hypothetical protein EN783_18255 [Mesorhizobium sp. M2D.F.Ca.ET.140.01.1.1]TGP16257.1 hypothetical protein EN876_17170 [Mesorhizobium sp. M2D.F.Ca.ET.233.01.1.1]TGP36839.1 hypothetical protein EN875_004545 [Mesorhizobium sp. M2D.F.Ca.ET.232.01.1.1]TGP65073.1 hypothetical protein EN869_000880 [Mesorhizobium sp. M2D.F.Ca.ET.226.01.1.1]TGP71548.1 hypothetical protein EN868_00880 [Mesorhizobium sp. M2D.F.Ca.ET.225.01.1.1]TGP74488.1 hypothetical protein EN867_18770 [Mesorhizobium sp. M2D.F.Ca.ET